MMATMAVPTVSKNIGTCERTVNEPNSRLMEAPKMGYRRMQLGTNPYCEVYSSTAATRRRTQTLAVR